jgi:hypothetical protein
VKGSDAMEIAFGIFLGFLLCKALSGNVSNIPSGKWWKTDYDSTDNVKEGVRSGLGLYIDHGTGCHYISIPPLGTLTPRLDASGKQICEAPDGQ